jgi:energy-coupling factor transporter ATP-binding protein EcfA2
MTERLREFLREDLRLNDGMRHVAVIGRPGSGKTTFINSIRGFYPDAYEGDVTEFGPAPARRPMVRGRVSGPMRFQSSLTPGIVWWDMPSIPKADERPPLTIDFYRPYELALYDHVILLYEGLIDSVSRLPVPRPRSC